MSVNLLRVGDLKKILDKHDDSLPLLIRGGNHGDSVLRDHDIEETEDVHFDHCDTQSIEFCENDTKFLTLLWLD